MMKNIPKLRFPEFRDAAEWEEKKLAQIIDFKSGYAFSSSSMSNEVQQYQLIKMSNVYQNTLALDRNPSYWHELNKAESEFLLNKGDVVLTLTGTVGKKDYGYSVMIEEDDKFLLNQRLVRLRAINGVSVSEFIKYLALNEMFLDSFFTNSRGGTGNQSNVSVEDLKRIKLPLPLKEEQQKIADCLSSIDELISSEAAKVEALKEHKKALMQRLFPREGETVPRLRFPEFQNAPEWEEKPLGDLLDYEQPTNYLVDDTNYNDEFKTPVLTAGKTFILGYTNETHGIFQNPLPVIIFDDFTTATQFVDFPFKAKSSAMKILKPKNNFVNIKIIFELMQTIKYQADEHKRYWISEYQDLEIKLPSKQEQQKIADCLSSIDELISSQAAKVETLKEHKKALMQQLFPTDKER